MEKHKYVKLYYGYVIFPFAIAHSDFRSLRPESAGFCTINTETQTCLCFGESISLNLKSDKNDSDGMTMQFFNQY